MKYKALSTKTNGAISRMKRVAPSAYDFAFMARKMDQWVFEPWCYILKACTVPSVVIRGILFIAPSCLWGCCTAAPNLWHRLTSSPSSYALPFFLQRNHGLIHGTLVFCTIKNHRGFFHVNFDFTTVPTVPLCHLPWQYSDRSRRAKLHENIGFY